MASPLQNPWLPVLTSPSPSEAIERAAVLPSLQHCALPTEYARLSRRARRNLDAVRRSLGLGGARPSALGAALGRSAPRPRKRPRAASSSSSDGEGAPEAPPEPAATPAELAHAATLHKWALQAPHTEPPRVALDAVLAAVHPACVLPIVLPDNAPAEAAAAVIASFTNCAGVTVVASLVQDVLVRRVSMLVAPAPRDVMQAVVALAERHWRAAIGLFELLAEGREKINGPIAEILVRVAAAVEIEGAVQALRTCCEGVWGEDGVRVVEALISRCKSEQHVAEIVVPGLERNVNGLEKSLRFGKLLLVVVKEVPQAAEKFTDVIRSVAGRSTVFLAKRAISLLPNSD